MFGRLKVFEIIAALVIIVVISPRIAAAWLLNLANTKIAYAASMPPRSPLGFSALDDAENDLNQARGLAPLDRAPLARARILLARRDAADAVRALQSAGDALNADSVAHWIWADAAWQSNQPAIAFEQWRAAGAFEYFSQQMHRAQDAHEWQSAIDAARIAVGIDPQSADAHLVLGDALSRQDINNPEAVRELARAQQLTNVPDLLSAIISRQGEILASQGKFQDALDAFSRARAIAPIDARPRTGYALTLLKLQPAATDQAVALLTQVVGDSPWYTAAYIALANIAETRGDLKGAEEWYQKGLARNPDNPDLLFALGQFYARQNRVAEATATLSLAMAHETRIDNLAAIIDALAKLKTK